MKHRWRPVLSLLVVFSMGCGMLSGIAQAADPTLPNNIALNKTVFVSAVESIQQGNTGEKAVDGDDATRWSTGQGYSANWITIDLGATYDITGARLKWEAAYAKQYQLLVSNDNVTFTKVYDGTATGAGVQMLSFTGTGRYIRMNATSLATAYGCSLYDFGVAGTLSATQGTAQALLSQHKPIVASSAAVKDTDASYIYKPAYANDGIAEPTNSDNRWSALNVLHDPSDPQWLAIDLQKVSDITQVSINWEAAYAQTFQIQVSNDFKTFTTVYSGGATTNGIQVVTSAQFTGGTPARGRYIRLMCLTQHPFGSQPYSYFGYSLYEMDVYGQPAADQSASRDVVNFNLIKTAGGTVTSTATGWAPKGDTVTLTFAPQENNTLQSVLVNGAEQVSSVQNNKLTLTASQDLNVSVVFQSVPGRRYEAENADRVDKNGNTDTTWTPYQNGSASGGAFMGDAVGRGLVFHNIAQSNRISVAYSTGTNGMIFAYLQGTDGSYKQIAAIRFTSTNSWDPSSNQVASSDAVNIPQGATVKLVAQDYVNLDYMMFTDDPLTAENKVPANTALAKNAQLNGAATVSDLLSTVGTAVQMTNGQSVTFTVPAGLPAQNVCELKYSAPADTAATITVGGGQPQAVTLAATSSGLYGVYSAKYAGLTAGTKVTVTAAGSGTLYIDSLTFHYAKDGDKVTVASLPTGSARETVPLDGLWDCTHTQFEVGDPVPQSVPSAFTNSIPVPGLWDLASYDMGVYNNAALWYKKTVNLPAAPTGNVTLRINKAYYGRYIYIDGQYVGNFQYNYVGSNTDITKYLKAGDNEIVIMLGNYLQQRDDPNCIAHIGTDSERNTYYSGIVDSVSLILNDDPMVTAVQTAPNIQNGTVQTRTTLQNDSAAAVTTDVTYNVYELGVFHNGVPAQQKVKVGSYTQTGVTVPANGSVKVDVSAITLSNFDASKYWSPESPFLYEIEVVTSGDTFSEHFGMRSFYFDPTTKLPMLNGKVYYLRGTNIAMNRFYEDPQRGQYPWNASWARQLFQDLKATNMNALRFHIGAAPSLWYEIADEEGYLIQDEYAWWSNVDGTTADTLAPEVQTWIDEKNHDPSIFIWDIQNECRDTSVTGQVIDMVRSYDIAGRSWDNGWGDNWAPPHAPTDTYEVHNYPFMNPSFRLSMLNNYTNYDNHPEYTNPKLLNEYGWLWLNRDGSPTTLTQGNYGQMMPGATADQRFQYYADAVSQLTEFFRVTRHFIGVMQFCALSYSKPSGATSDILMPDLSTPTIRSVIQQEFKNAFAPVGIVIKDWSETVVEGATKTLPVAIINDKNEDISGLTVTLTLYNGDTAVSSQTKTYNVKQAGDAAGGDLVSQDFTVNVPQLGASQYRVVASYQMGGETVTSVRKWTVNASQQLGLCYNKPTTASYSEGNMKPNLATDGDDTTRWSSFANGADPDPDSAWLTVDLGQTYNLNKVELLWESAYASNYQIQVSNDNQNFTTIYTGTASAAGKQMLDVSGSGRYLRLQCVKRSTPYGISLYTFDAWGTSLTDKTALNSVISKTVGLPQWACTADTWSALQTTLAAAQQTAADDSAAQTQIDASAAAVLSALRGVLPQSGRVLNNVSPGTTAAGLAQALYADSTVQQGVAITLQDSSGNVIPDGSVVGTGAVVTAGGSKYLVVIAGDLNGDGSRDASDLLLLKRALLGLGTPAGSGMFAANVDKDAAGGISSSDLLLLKRSLLGLSAV